MAKLSLGSLTSNGTTGEAAWEFINDTLTPAKIMRIVVSLVAATATTLGLGRPAAKGITPTTPVALLAEDEIATQTGLKTAMAWATKPTIPAAFYRRVGLPAVIGQTYEFEFVKGLYVPAAATVILWNLAANSVLNVTVEVEDELRSVA